MVACSLARWCFESFQSVSNDVTLLFPPPRARTLDLPQPDLRDTYPMFEIASFRRSDSRKSGMRQSRWVFNYQTRCTWIWLQTQLGLSNGDLIMASRAKPPVELEKGKPDILRIVADNRGAEGKNDFVIPATSLNGGKVWTGLRSQQHFPTDVLTPSNLHSILRRFNPRDSWRVEGANESTKHSYTD